jgi:hypothetical protein
VMAGTPSTGLLGSIPLPLWEPRPGSIQLLPGCPASANRNPQDCPVGVYCPVGAGWSPARQPDRSNAARPFTLAMPAPRRAAGRTPSRADPRPLRQGALGAERGEAWDARAEVRRAPREDAAEGAALEAAWVDELASVGTLQIVLTRRVAVVVSRLARADRMETELLAERRWDNAGMGPDPRRQCGRRS